MNEKVRIYEKLNDASKFTKSIDEDGYMHLKGVFGVCGIKNRNNRRYVTENYGLRVKELQERIKQDGGIPGELEHPNTMTISYENASHSIVGIDIDEKGVVTGEIKLLHTPKGQIAEEIVKGGLPLFISSRAQGSIDKNGVVTLESISTYDIVSQPGFAEARLHLNESLIVESEGEDGLLIVKEDEDNQDNKPNDMTQEETNKLMEEIQQLKTELATLKEQVNENKPDYGEMADAIQKWLMEEYTPKVQEWIVEEYGKDIREKMVDDCNESMKKMMVDKIAPAFQQWVVEEYSKVVSDWVTEEYSAAVNEWITTEYANAINEWITTEYSDAVNEWMTTEFSKVINEKLETIADQKLNESRESKLSAIDDVLSILESNEPAKPTYGRIVENKTENQPSDEPLFIREMPAHIAPKWNMASQDIKESVMRKARLYNLTNESQIERFWNGIDFDSIKPAANIYEGLENVSDEREKALRMQLRRRFNA